MSRRSDSSVQEFAGNIARHFATTVVVYLSGFLLSVWVARTLGPREMGMYSYAMWLLSLLVLFASAGFPTALTKYTAELVGRGSGELAHLLFWRILPWQLLVALSLALFVLLLGSSISFGLASPSALPLLALGVPLLAGTSLLTAFFQGRQRFSALLRINTATALLSIVVTIIILSIRPDASGAIGAVILASAVQMLALLRAGRKSWKSSTPPQRLDRSLKQRFLRYTLMTFGIMLVDAVVWRRSEVFFLKLFAPLEQIAVYSISFGLLERANTLLPGVFSTVLLPSLSHSLGRQDSEASRATHDAATKYLAMTIMPLFVGMALLASPFIELVYGAAYIAAVPVLRILFLTGIAGALASTASTLLYAQERQLFIMAVGVSVALLNILLDLLLIPRYAAVGAALANGTAQIAAVVVGIGYLVRTGKMRFPWINLGKISLGTASMTVVVSGVLGTPFSASLRIALAIAGGVISYGFLMVRLGVVVRRELIFLRGAIVRPTFPPLLIRTANAIFDMAERYVA